MATLNGPDAEYDSNGWFVNNDFWDMTARNSGYSLSGTYNPSDLTTGLSFSWNFGALPTDGYYWVHAYPEIGFGQDAWSKTIVPGEKPFPLSLANLSKLQVNYDASWGGQTDGYNVALELYLNSSPGGGAGTITNEVMVWIHNGGWHPGGSPIGSFSDSNYSGQIYSYPVYESGLNFNYTALLTNTDDPRGTIDVKAIMQKLRSLGIITGNEYLSTIQLGAEIAAGTGSLSVNKLQLDVQTAGSSEVLIDGTGTTPVTSSNPGSGSGSGTGSTSPSSASGNAQGVLWSDFSGDSNSDIVFSNNAGQALIWSMDGGALLSASSVIGSFTPSGVGIIGAADFNGDGKPDLLVQDASGQAYIWTMNGLTRQSTTAVGTNPGEPWEVMDAGDFNGDGKADILWWDTSSGQAKIWLMNGTTVTRDTTIGSPGANWQAITTGDFSGNNRSDIVWQNTSTGQLQIWMMDGATVLSKNTVSTNLGSSWHVVGNGDFNGDNKSDIVLQADSDAVQIWEMNGSSIYASTAIGSPGSGWKAVGTGDYNDDGKDDILFQNTSGQIMVWLMNGTSVQSRIAGSNPGSAWHAAVT